MIGAALHRQRYLREHGKLPPLPSSAAACCLPAHTPSPPHTQRPSPEPRLRRCHGAGAGAGSDLFVSAPAPQVLEPRPPLPLPLPPAAATATAVQQQLSPSVRVGRLPCIRSAAATPPCPSRLPSPGGGGGGSSGGAGGGDGDEGVAALETLAFHSQSSSPSRSMHGISALVVRGRVGGGSGDGGGRGRRADGVSRRKLDVGFLAPPRR